MLVLINFHHFKEILHSLHESRMLELKYLNYRDIGNDRVIISVELYEPSRCRTYSNLVNMPMTKLPNLSELLTTYVNEQDVVAVIDNGECITILNNKNNNRIKLDEKDVVRINKEKFAYNNSYYYGRPIPFDIPREVYYLPSFKPHLDKLIFIINREEIALEYWSSGGNYSEIQKIILERLKLGDNNLDVINDANKYGIFGKSKSFTQECYYQMILLGKCETALELVRFISEPY